MAGGARFGGRPFLSPARKAASTLRPLSLQAWIIAMMAVVLATCMLGGSALLSLHARELAAAEVETAFHGSVLSVTDTLRSNVQHTITLRQVVGSFQGQRHVRASLVNEDGRIIVQSDPAPITNPAPGWFESLVAPPSMTATIPFALKGYPCLVRLTSDPRNKVAEIWASAKDTFAIMLLFCVMTMIVVSLAAATSSRFFARFRAGLMTVAAGDYSARIAGAGPREFRELAHGFNEMAAQLAELQRRNGQLGVQLQTTQADERSGLARDLHDEIGPHLFALQVDAKAISKLGTPEAEQLGFAVRDTVGRIQQEVSAILRRLRPLTQLEFGLEQAIADLVAFWTRRHPSIAFETRIDLAGGLDRVIEETAYRVVQESLSNAVRHGQPSRISISLGVDGQDFIVAVSDNGRGAPTGPAGMSLGQAGIAGMEHRVKDAQGTLHIETVDGRGVIVRAVLPLPRSYEAA